MIASPINLTAKKSHYGVDGSGRDSYIHFDNGGNYRGYRLEGLGKFEVGTFRQKTVSRRKSYTNVEGRPLHYIGDGSGRDAYVMYFYSYAVKIKVGWLREELVRSLTFCNL